ncbi:hypothetical protein ACIQGZ_07350 [Streptomyces sp. NPDC092296]
MDVTPAAPGGRSALKVTALTEAGVRIDQVTIVRKAGTTSL